MAKVAPKSTDFITSKKIYSFTNVHGEVFKIIDNSPLGIFMFGDEVNYFLGKGSIISLFNDKFNIWSKDELKEVAKILLKIANDE